MGLMLSILVICVGVIEVLSCYEHFQYGVLHCATNIYESTRRSSIFLKYTSGKLRLLATESAAPKLNRKHEKNFKPFKSFDESVNILKEVDLSKEHYSCEPAKKSTIIDYSSRKLEKPDKIDIVKKHFERPAIRRPKPVRSISMPELTYTEEDYELSKIINDLAIEPIEEVDIEIETTYPEALVKEFEDLFVNFEKLAPSFDSAEKHLSEHVTQAAQDLKLPISTNKEEAELNLTDKVEINLQNNLNTSSEESKKDGFNQLRKNFSGEKSRSKSFSDKGSDPEPIVTETYSKETLVKQYLSQATEKRQLKRSTSAFENKISPVIAKNISSAPTEEINVPMLISTSAIPFNKSFDYDKPDSLNKLAHVNLENETPTNAFVEMIDKTFEEIYGDLNDESSDVINMYEEIEENILDELEKEGKIKDIDVNRVEPQTSDIGAENSSVKILCKNIPETTFLKAIDQLADLIVKDCLGELKHLCLEQFTGLNSPTKEKTNDDKDSADVLKLHNYSVDKPNFSQSSLDSNENFQSETRNCRILENHGEQVLMKNFEILTKHIPKMKKSLQVSCFANDLTSNLIIDHAPLSSITPITEPELSKFSDKPEYGTLIHFEDAKTVIKPTVDHKTLCTLENISNPALKITQQSEDSDVENNLTKSTPRLGRPDSTPDKTKPFLGEKTKLLAIKGEVLSAIEYKSKGNNHNQEFKKEIIPMQWKTAISEESATAGNLPEVSENFSKTALERLKMSQSEDQNGSHCLRKQSVGGNKENEVTGEFELSSSVSMIKPNASNEHFCKVKTTLEQTLDRGISNPLEGKKKEGKGQLETQNSNIRGLSSSENIAREENVTKLNTPINNNNKPLAVKGEVLLSLEYKNKNYNNDTNEKNKKEIIPLEWKTNMDKASVNDEKFGLTNKENLTATGVQPTHIHKEVEKRENNSEEIILDSKNSMKLVSSEADITTTASEPGQILAEINTDKICEPKEASNSKIILKPDFEETQTFLKTSPGDVTKTEILKQKASVIPKPKPNSEFSQSLSPDCGSSEETINVIKGISGNESIPKMQNPIESEKENKNEHSNDSKKLNARNNNKEVKDTNSAPEAFWLIFSGEYTKAMSKEWHTGHFSCWQCDEALTGQRYVLRDDHPYCIKCYESVFANVCEECNKIIGIDSKDLSYKDKHWHEACFLCNKCRVSLVDKQFGSKADKIYCGNCYDAQFASRCDGCGEIFRAGTKKMEYKTRQWHEKCFCCCVCKTPIGTKSFIPREQEIYCATCYEEKFATRCVKCNKIITSGGVTYKNEPWHRECFTCTNCNTSLAGQRFTSRDEKPYCADCFGELFAKRCTACNRPITGIGGTRFISFEDRHWHNDCFICASCKTSLVGRGFITDGDDIICPECAKQKLM